MTIARSIPTEQSAAFDEAYFERGWERGTAYVNYSSEAAQSPIYRGIAQLFARVFQPAKALEIGCATGPIVKHMNDRGIETHGIDVSEWAVANALHPNVMLASAADLPFASGSFDLVYSSHALEHLPPDIQAAAFRDIDRVSAANAVQFHMLPIVGTYPYDYDREAVIRELQKDPTHVLLKPMDWWLEQWAQLGWEAIRTPLFIAADTDNAELSSGQFCLVRQGSGLAAPILEAITAANAESFRQTSMARSQLERERGNSNLINGSVARFRGQFGPFAEPRWDDMTVRFAIPVDLSNTEIQAVVRIEASKPVALRIALVSSSGAVAEKWLELAPGWSHIRQHVREFRQLSGTPQLSEIVTIHFGGETVGVALEAELALS